MSVCIPTYMLASGLIAGGMSWWQAIGTILLGNLIVLIPMLLNAHAGTRYGIPFPVFVRASFGVRGANVPAVLRALVACGWFGIQTWIGGQAIYSMPQDCLACGGTVPRRNLGLFFRFLVVEHDGDLARHRNHQGAGRRRRAVYAGRGAAVAVLDHAQGGRLRTGTERSRQVHDIGFVFPFLYSVAHRDGGLLGHRRAQYSGFHALREIAARPGCGPSAWACRRP